ncbi:MAG: ATP-binding cassette domain-containing protein [Cyclobacteriaceae bacterium]
MISVDVIKSLRSPSGTLELKVALEIQEGSLTTLYGESGAGKTSTLRMIAGLMRPDSGKIVVDGDTWFDASSGIDLPPQHRNTGFVFQDYALFPHLTVAENIRFGIQYDTDHHLVGELIELMALGDLSESKPSILSGGQQQRVALARAIAQKPKVLLLDEPLSALDPKARFRLQEYLIYIKKEYGQTILMISHDIGEIYRVSDHVLELQDGKVIQSGAASHVFNDENISGKFRFRGEVLQIVPNGAVMVITVLVGQDTVRIISAGRDASHLSIGDHVMVASKAFNPLIYKISN